MKTTQQLIDEGKIPSEIASRVMVSCPYDGFPIIRNEGLTVAFCARPHCVGHMKYQLDDLLKHLGVKGIGPQTCEIYVSNKEVTNIFQAAEKVLGYKPQMHLSEIAKFANTRGLSNEWENILAGYHNFSEFFSSDEAKPYIGFASKLKECEKYVNVLKPMSREKIEVMITGSVAGYRSRDLFIQTCNEIVGKVIRIKLCGSKQSADYLIVEDKDQMLEAARRGGGSAKARAAIAGGVKVVTSKEFLAELVGLVNRLLSPSP